MVAPTKTKAASAKDPQTKRPKSATANVHPASTETTTTTTTTTTTSPVSAITLVEYGSGKPDKASYDKEQERIKAEIDVLQARAVCVIFVLLFHFVRRFRFESDSSVLSCVCVVFCYGRLHDSLSEGKRVQCLDVFRPTQDHGTLRTKFRFYSIPAPRFPAFPVIFLFTITIVTP